MTTADLLQRNARTPQLRVRSPSAHLIGIAGAGMRALADVLSARGWRVSGTDAAEQSTLATRFDLQQLASVVESEPTLDLVVHSAAVPVDDAQLQLARARGLRTVSYPQMVGRLMRGKFGIAIAGTHGKSTVTAMVSRIMLTAGLDPTVICGATPLGETSGGRAGRGDWLLAEACEYRAHFRHLRPRVATILSIELDHFDYFHSRRHLERTFERFAHRVPANGILIASHDCASTRRVLGRLSCPQETFGVSADAVWQATALALESGIYSCSIHYRGKHFARVSLGVPGRHNVQNALAAAAVAYHCGASQQAITDGLGSFAGLHRRMELVRAPTVGGPAIVDDYAHHPSEVSAALATVRAMFPQRRLWCVFQPHQRSRTRHLLEEFAHSLQNADRIIVADTFTAREPVADGPDELSRQLAERTRQLGAAARHVATRRGIVNLLEVALGSSDVLITMGAGDIGKIAHELDRRLRIVCQAS